MLRGCRIRNFRLAENIKEFFLPSININEEYTKINIKSKIIKVKLNRITIFI